MKKIFFYTPTLISHIDLMTMGGSEKAEDDTKLGMYCSGLKHAMALFMRNGVAMNIKVIDYIYSDNHDRSRATFYNLNTYTEYCEQTEKEKELIQIHKDVNLESFFSVHCEDLGGGDLETEILKTGFSTKLGIDWELWMGLREIYSNMIDEGGYYTTQPDDAFKYGTVVELSFEEDNEFDEIWNNRHLYINETAPLFVISDRVEALENEENYLRIYKQNILVYQDVNIPSKYAYNVKFGKIDEKRILSDLYGVGDQVISAIRYTQNEEYLRTIITTEAFSKEEFLYDRGCYGTASQLINDIATEVWLTNGEVNTYPWLLNSIKERADCVIGGKIITTIQDSLYSYSNKVIIESTPAPFAEPSIEVEDEVFIDPFSAEIKKYYNFNLDVEVKKAKLKGSKVVADKYEKCLIIDENFNLETDFPEFLVQYIDLTQSGNVIKNLSLYICKLLKV